MPHKEPYDEVVSDEEYSTDEDVSTDDEADTNEAAPETNEKTGQEPNGDIKYAPEGSLASRKNLYQSAADKNGKWTWVDKEPKDVIAAAENSETAQHAIITKLTKAGDSRKTYDIETIIIQSPQLKTALSEVLQGYPGVHCGLKRLEFKAPFQPFVHRWSELSEFRARENDKVTTEHVELLYNVLREELEDVIKTIEDFVHHGVVTFEHVWAIFPPGTIVYSASHNGTHGASKLRSGSYRSTQCGRLFQLSVDVIDWDGKNFGRDRQSISIPEFAGTQSILSLKAFPFSFHPIEKQIKEMLITRGKKFEQLAGAHYREYDGIAISWDRQGHEIPYHCQGRVIVDSDCYSRFSPRYVHSVDALTHSESMQDEQECEPKQFTVNDLNGTSYVFGKQGKSKRVRLTEDHHLLCMPHVRGYSLQKKEWLLFYVDMIKDIKFTTKAFESLVLPEDQKELILSFAESQAMNQTSFDDVISGKGRGHITLLSGPPGVGKTLTAEAVAEYMHAPLYMMSAGDLGINPDQVESKLTNILEMIAKWNAVLLLDECDVFLEARSTHDLERNKLVSIFLRTLEYYEGLLFLTTNRVSNIDAAFQSRIHISMAYPDLNVNSRRVIWENFLKNMAKETTSKFTKEDLDELAAVELNGRQIKNVLKSAALLASRKRDALSRQYVETVLAIEGRRPGVAKSF